jgi:hypothetical protein
VPFHDPIFRNNGPGRKKTLTYARKKRKSASARFASVGKKEKENFIVGRFRHELRKVGQKDWTLK